LPTQFEVVLFEDDRYKHLIRVAGRVGCEESQQVTGDTMLNFVERPKPLRMPQSKRRRLISISGQDGQLVSETN